jgi:hypothetical protein
MLGYFPRKFFAPALSYTPVSCTVGACAIHPASELFGSFAEIDVKREMRQSVPHGGGQVAAATLYDQPPRYAENFLIASRRDLRSSR